MWDDIKDMLEDTLIRWITISVTGMFFLTIWAMVIEQQEWAKFSKDNNCQIVGKMNGQTFNTIDTRGTIGFGSTSSQTGYLCNNGITYWR